jgi:hypothetical protein
MKNLLFVLMAMLVLSCGPNPTLIDFDDLSTMTVLKKWYDKYCTRECW